MVDTLPKDNRSVKTVEDVKEEVGGAELETCQTVSLRREGDEGVEETGRRVAHGVRDERTRETTSITGGTNGVDADVFAFPHRVLQCLQLAPVCPSQHRLEGHALESLQVEASEALEAFVGVLDPHPARSSREGRGGMQSCW